MHTSSIIALKIQPVIKQQETHNHNKTHAKVNVLKAEREVSINAV